jgi:hypothetical protein
LKVVVEVKGYSMLGMRRLTPMRKWKERRVFLQKRPALTAFICCILYLPRIAWMKGPKVIGKRGLQ